MLNGFSVGYMGGFGARITKHRIFGEMNFNFIRSGIPLNLPRIVGSSRKSDVRVSAFELPIVGGYKFVNKALFKWSMYAGINTLLITKVSDNQFGFEKSRLKNPQFGARFGSGVDLAFFTLNLHYTYGLNGLIKEGPRGHSHFFEFNIGVIF